MKKKTIFMNKVKKKYTVMYEFWYDYMKSKYRDKTKLFYMNTEDIYVDIAKDVEAGFETSNYN